MTRKDKLIARFITLPSDFHYDELVNLLGLFGFREVKSGKTSGSRVKFIDKNGKVIFRQSLRLGGVGASPRPLVVSRQKLTRKALRVNQREARSAGRQPLVGLVPPIVRIDR